MEGFKGGRHSGGGAFYRTGLDSLNVCGLRDKGRPSAVPGYARLKKCARRRPGTALSWVSDQGKMAPRVSLGPLTKLEYGL